MENQLFALLPAKEWEEIKEKYKKLEDIVRNIYSSQNDPFFYSYETLEKKLMRRRQHIVKKLVAPGYLVPLNNTGVIMFSAENVNRVRSMIERKEIDFY